MIKSINKLFHSVELDYGNKKMTLGEIRNDETGSLIKLILHSFIQYNLVSIRILNRIFLGDQSLKERSIWRKGKYNSLSNNDIELVKAIDYLLFLIQDYQTLVNNCRYLSHKDLTIFDDLSLRFFISQIIKAASFKEYWENTNKKPKENEELKFETKLNDLNFKYRIDEEFDSYRIKSRHIFSVISVSDENGREVDLDTINFFSLLASLLDREDFKSLLNMKFETV